MPREIRNEANVRTFLIEREAVREDGGLDISFSSETDEVERWFGVEILSHDKGAMDMKRAKNGLPLLMDHGRTLVGRVENIRIGDDKKGRGTIRFSASEQAQEVRTDMLDGIRPDISVAYRTLEYKTEKGKAGKADTVTVTRWQPYEISSVAVPADSTVGVGRALDENPAELQPINPAPVAATKEVRMEPKDNAATEPVNVTQLRTEAVNATRDEARELSALAAKYNKLDQLPKWFADSRSIQSVKDEIMESLRTLPLVPLQGNDLKLNDKDSKQFSIARAILSQANGTSSFEKEISADIAKRMGRETNGIYIPSNLALHGLSRAAASSFDAVTAGAAKEMINTERITFIEILRNRTRVMQMGATFMPGLVGNVPFTRQATAGGATWTGDNPASGVAASNPTVEQFTMTPKQLMANRNYSKQLLVQTGGVADAFVTNDLVFAHSLELDRCAIHGLGSSNEPKGILATSGIGDVAIGATGGPALYTHIVQLEGKLADANADIGAMGYLTNSGQMTKLKQIAVLANTANIPVWTGGIEGQMNGYKAYASNQVSRTLSKSSSGAVLSAILFGVWSELLIGEWGAFELLTDPYFYADQGIIRVISTQFADLAVRHAASFAAIKDAS